MSYKVAFFGVPVGEPLEGSISQFREMASELRMENGYDGVYLVTNSDEDAQASGLRLFYLAASPAPGGRVSRDFFTERWTDLPLHSIVYDDQNGYFMWTHHPVQGRSESIVTEGHRVGLRNLQPTSDYPQKAFTNAELDAAFRKPESELTDAEAKALMEYDDAITIALRHFGFDSGRNKCLDLLYAKSAWSLLDAPPVEKPLPDDAGPIVDFYLEHYDLTSHGLEARHY